MDEVYAKLVHPKSQACEGENTADWSCVRHITKEMLAARDKTEFGFQVGEGKNKDGSFPTRGGTNVACTRAYFVAGHHHQHQDMHPQSSTHT